VSDTIVALIKQQEQQLQQVPPQKI
jgi:hypothetical protein